MEEEYYDVEDFWKFDLKVGHVIDAERLPRTRKLIRLEVDFGKERRTIVAGIGDQFTPDMLIGKKYVFVLNIKPRKFAGVESKGMILAAEDEKGKLYLITAEGDAPSGSKVY